MLHHKETQTQGCLGPWNLTAHRVREQNRVPQPYAQLLVNYGRYLLKEHVKQLGTQDQSEILQILLCYCSKLPPWGCGSFYQFLLEAQRTPDSFVLTEAQFTHSKAHNLLNAQPDECFTHMLTQINSYVATTQIKIENISFTPEGSSVPIPCQ